MSQHFYYLLPKRVLDTLIDICRASFTRGVEHAAMIFGRREQPEAIVVGAFSVGSESNVYMRHKEMKAVPAIASFHTHVRYPPLLSLGDGDVECLAKRRYDRWGAYEGFAIGYPRSESEGDIVFYQVADWDEFCMRVKDAYNYFEELERSVSTELASLRATRYLWDLLFGEERYVQPIVVGYVNYEVYLYSFEKLLEESIEIIEREIKELEEREYGGEEEE